MDLKDLLETIKQPESDVLEFKTQLPDSSHIAKLISAFANTKGGTLIVGVKEGGEIVGIDDPIRVQRILEQATGRVSPPVAIHSNVLSFDGKKILVATIHKGLQSPYVVDGQIFQRVGDRIVPITSSILYENIEKRVKNINDINNVLSELERLTQIVENMNREIIAARSWRSKMADMVLGGIIGALISAAFAILLNVG